MTTVRVYAENGSFRSHDSNLEMEAYGSGAAALVPYQPLRAMVEEGKLTLGIARFFKVSRDLVVFRTKVTKLYSRLRA